MDEEQIILLLREMRAEMRAEIKDIKTTLNNVQMDINAVRSSVTNIEQTHGPLLRAMADAQVIYEEKFYTHEPRIERLEETARQHDRKISHLFYASRD